MKIPIKELESIWKACRDKAYVVGYSSQLMPKIKKGKIMKRKKAIRIYVSEKIPISKLAPRDVIPGYFTIKISNKEKRIETDVVEIGIPYALKPRRARIRRNLYRKKYTPQDKQKRWRPVPPGVSIGHYKITAGTLGFYARDKETGKVVGISNNHVLANSNKAKLQDPILQPGPYDKGKLEDKVGFLLRYIPLNYNYYKCKYRNFFHGIVKLFKDIKPNEVDLAIFQPIVEINPSILDIGKPLGTKDVKIEDTVHKSGRTTCHTVGKVIDTAWNGYVMYNNGSLFFKDQILIEKEGFSDAGDSGSAILDINRNIIGLLFAGSATHTIANKINKLII